MNGFRYGSRFFKQAGPQFTRSNVRCFATTPTVLPKAGRMARAQFLRTASILDLHLLMEHSIILQIEELKELSDEALEEEDP